MKEKLIIKNFGPIKSVELELGRFNVLIGEQATGKSTVAKLLAVCRYFSYIINYKNDEWFEHNFIEGLKSWGLNEALKESTYIYYKCLDYEFVCKAHKVTEADQEYGLKEWITVHTSINPLSVRFKKLLKELDNLRLNLGTNFPINVTIPYSFFQNDVGAVMDNPFYLPTERGLQSIFSLGKNSIPNINDSLYNQFTRIDQMVRLFNLETEIEPLNIIYKNESGRAYIRKKNENDFFSLNNGASGHQSTIPIVLATKYYSEIKKKNKTFITEEPELNLFPEAQYRLINYLVDKIINYKNSILITTHSPYVLTSLNNLIYAYKIGQLYPEQTVKIIKKKYWLNQQDLSVYMMLPDGTCEDIFDREEGLIKAEKIDGVSGLLNKEFEELLNIEYAEK